MHVQKTLLACTGFPGGMANLQGCMEGHPSSMQFFLASPGSKAHAMESLWPCTGPGSPHLALEDIQPLRPAQGTSRGNALQAGPHAPRSSLCILLCPGCKGQLCCPSTPQTAPGLQLEQELFPCAWPAVACSSNFPGGLTVWEHYAILGHTLQGFNPVSNL